MYQIFKNSLSMWIIDTEPTPEQLEDLGCDSYELYEEPAETPEQQKARVKQALISTPDLSAVDLEWVIFSDIEIGEIIRSRVFAGNPYAESALQAKTSAYILSVVSGEPNETLLVSIQEKQRQINEVRWVFGLTSIQ
mgnify:CR=1 FL=1